MKTIVIIVPKGTAAFGGYLADETDVAFDVHDADLADFVEHEDVVAQILVSLGHVDLLPLLTHRYGAVTVAYSPSGNRVEQTAEEVKAVKAVEKLPDEERFNTVVEPPVAEEEAPKPKKPATKAKPAAKKAK